MTSGTIFGIKEKNSVYLRKIVEHNFFALR